MHKWTNDERMMMRLLQRRDPAGDLQDRADRYPETEEEREWLEKQNFKNTAEDAYTG